MKIQQGQKNEILNYFPLCNIDKSYIEFEAGNDNGTKFNGSYIVHIHYKGNYKFENSKLIKKVS